MVSRKSQAASEGNALHVLEKGLRAEFDAVTFYLSNLDRLNYRGNKDAIDHLILDSIEHARWLAMRLLELRKEEGGELKRTAIQSALLEEFSMREIYRYELNRSPDRFVQALMKRLIAEEETHEKLVDGLQ